MPAKQQNPTDCFTHAQPACLCQIPRWDTSKIRAQGTRLKTFGGRASGPEPLESLFLFAVQLFTGAKGRQLSSLECHDLVCKVAEIVVVGGVRRCAACCRPSAGAAAACGSCFAGVPAPQSLVVYGCAKPGTVRLGHLCVHTTAHHPLLPHRPCRCHMHLARGTTSLTWH